MSPIELSDHELIRAYLDGEQDQFEVLYGRYKRPLYGYLNKMMPGQTATVDDVFQKAWLKVIQNLERYKDQKNFFAWLVRIARNCAIDYFRKASREIPVDLEAGNTPVTMEMPWKQMGNRELSDAIKKAVDQLPADQRDVFLLRQDDVPFKEIARIQDASLNTVLGRMHYAVKRLRQLLNEWK
jgi:RNA polymerase sigma-70 factor (ECF subfamily)